MTEDTFDTIPEQEIPEAEAAGITTGDAPAEAPLGSVKYDDRVIKKIIASALMNVDGFLGASTGFIGGIASVLQKSAGVEEDVTKGIAMEVKDGAVSVTIKSVVELGKSIPAIAAAMTQSITAALHDIAGLETKHVGVEVVDTMSRAEFEEKYVKHARAAEAPKAETEKEDDGEA